MSSGLSALAENFETWVDGALSDEQFSVFRRDTRLRLGFSDGETRVALQIGADGLGPCGDPEVTLVAPPYAWEQLLSRAPNPTMHHFLAMRMRVPGTSIDGDELLFAQHTHVIRRLIELARAAVDGPIACAKDPIGDLSGIAGRYLSVTIKGSTTDLYVERAGAGEGAPVLLLHTAGADSRQAHPLMSDPVLTGRHPIYSFDLPGHGRSTPLPGPIGSWSLTPDLYAQSILAIIERLSLDRPILVGASMAGEACLMMAHQIPEVLGGVIACEAAEYVPGRVTPWAGHPQVNEMIFVPEWINGLIGPTAPASMRRQILHTYGQGGHRIFAGDIDFYSGGWDGREIVADIDTASCPVVMMTGEYDYSCTPAMSKATAAKIVGAHYWTMPDMGHFPICEHPAAFLPHLERALSLIGEKR